MKPKLVVINMAIIKQVTKVNKFIIEQEGIKA